MNGRKVYGDDVKLQLIVDGKNIELNKFVEKILSGTLIGAISSLREIEEEWKELQINVTR